MIPYPSFISPVIAEIGPLKPHWYGAMYLLAFAIGWKLIQKYNRNAQLGLSKNDLLDLVLYILMGVVIGGRLGYMWFYNAAYYLEHPTKIFQIWLGGMSFHGGLIGVILALLYFAWRKQVKFFDIGDMIVYPSAIGIGLVRIGNFINAELYGRATDVPWCMVFPKRGAVDPGDVCRHPSQLYEAFFEGFLIALILRWMMKKHPKTGVLSWAFVVMYGVARFSMEYFREPDAHIGFIFTYFTLGQLLTLPLIVIGGYMLWKKTR